MLCSMPYNPTSSDICPWYTIWRRPPPFVSCGISNLDVRLALAVGRLHPLWSQIDYRVGKMCSRPDSKYIRQRKVVFNFMDGNVILTAIWRWRPVLTEVFVDGYVFTSRKTRWFALCRRDDKKLVPDWPSCIVSWRNCMQKFDVALKFDTDEH